MKKLVSLILIVFTLVACSTVATNSAESSQEPRFTSDTFFEYNNNETHIIKDEESGCKYLVVSQFQAGYGTSVTPLLKSDKTPDCDKE